MMFLQTELDLNKEAFLLVANCFNRNSSSSKFEDGRY